MVSAAAFGRPGGRAGERGSRRLGGRADSSFDPEGSSAGVVKTLVFSGPPDPRSLPKSLGLNLYYSFAFFSFWFIFSVNPGKFRNCGNPSASNPSRC